MDDDNGSEVLLRRIAELEARLGAVEATDEPRSSRRGLLKLAGAAAIGAVAAGGTDARRAAAADGEAITLGQAKVANVNRTRADYTGSLIGGQAFLFQSGNRFDGNSGLFAAALAGWGGTSAMPTGVYGFTDQGSASAIVGRAIGGGSPTGVYGVTTTSAGFGVKAENPGGHALSAAGGTGGVVASSTGIASVAISGTAPSTVDSGGLGVYGEGTVGVQGVAFGPLGIGVLAGLPTTGIGLRADGATAVKAIGAGTAGIAVDAAVNGVDARAIKAANSAAYGTAAEFQASAAGGTALMAQANGGVGAVIGGFTGVYLEAGQYAIEAKGDVASIYMPGINHSPPTRSNYHLEGELDGDLEGNLWWSVVEGAPGVWRKIAGPSTAGTLHVLNPSRVHDSRKPSANPITSTSGPRTVSIADKIDATGAVVTANLIPAGATAIAYNLTIVNTVGTNGYLAINPGGVTAVSASSINWSAAGLTLANASLVPVSAGRQVTVICGGSSTSCNFIIDVVGYYQ